MKKEHYLLLATLLLFVLSTMAQEPIGNKFLLYNGEKGIKRTISSLKITAADSRVSTGQPLNENMEVPLKARLDEFKKFKSSAKSRSRGEEEFSDSMDNSNKHTKRAGGTGTSKQAVKTECCIKFPGSFLTEDSTRTPPDPNGAVGPTQVVVTTNLSIKVFEKRGVTDQPLVTKKGISIDPAPHEFSISLNAFFSSLLRLKSYAADPHIRFDRLSKRWFIAAIEVDTLRQNNYVLLAVSDGERITNSSSFSFFRLPSAIFTYNRNAPKAPFFDYPTLGVDKNSILIGGNAYFANNSGLTDSINSVCFAIDKRSLLVRGSLTLYIVKVGSVSLRSESGVFTPQGVYNDDPLATKSFFAGTALSRDGIYLQSLTFNTASSPFVLTGLSSVKVPVDRFQYPRDVTAPGSPMPIDALDARLLAAAIYKNKINGKSSLWTAHAIGVNQSGNFVPDSLFTDQARTASRWYEIDSVYTAPHLNQAGTLFNPRPSGRRARMYFNPSIATNGQGRSVLSGTTAAFNQFLNVFVTGRNTEDPRGTLDSIEKVTTSRAIYAFTFNGVSYLGRWGDFSQTVVDPLDDQTIWTFQEYANAGDSYGTRAVQLKAPPPATPLPLGILSNKNDTLITLNGISVNYSGFFDPGSDPGGPGYNRLSVKSSGNVIVSNVKFISPTQITFSLNVKNKATGKYTLVITNPDGQIVTTDYTLRARTAAASQETKAVAGKIVQNDLHLSSIYPNPASDNFNLLMNAAKDMTGKIMLLDIKGKLLYERSYRFIKGVNQTTLSLAGHGNGTYIVVVYNANNALTATQIVIKQ